MSSNFIKTHPAIHNKCSSNCTLNITTVSQLVYSDSESGPNAALEIKIKLMSRQAILLSATGKTFDFNQTDGDNYRCAEINNKTIEWAISKAPKKTVERYFKHGRLLRVGEDIGPLSMGPLWVYYPMVSLFFEWLLKYFYFMLFFFFKELYIYQ